MFGGRSSHTDLETPADKEHKPCTQGGQPHQLPAEKNMVMKPCLQLNTAWQSTRPIKFKNQKPSTDQFSQSRGVHENTGECMGIQGTNMGIGEGGRIHGNE